MSDNHKATLDDVVILLRQIEKNQHPPFNAGTAIAVVLAGAFGFVIALALNNFLQQVFNQIPVGDGLLGAGIYAIIALIIGILALFLIYIYLEPWLTKKFAKKNK